MYILKVYSIHCTLRKNTTVTKNFFQTLFLLLRAPTHNSFTFNLRSLYVLKHKVGFSKTACGIFHFPFHFVFIKTYFFVNKMHGLENIIPFKIKIIEKPQRFAPRSLIFKLQQEVLKFNDFCVSWSSPKTDLVKNFLNSENRNFENFSFSQ